MKEIKLDKETKEMLAKISAAETVKADTIRQVWEYTLIAWFLQMTENPEEEYKEVTIPFLGKIGLQYKGERLDEATGKIKTDVDASISLSDNFKSMFGDIINQARTPLVDYIQEGLMNTTIDNITES